MIDAYASMGHYRDHLWPVWQALPEGVRGVFWTPETLHAWEALRRQGEPSRLTMVAGFADGQRMRDTPLVLVEHGAGQSYPGDPRSATLGSYSGGHGLERVRLFVCPNQSVADRWRETYPDTPCAVVGSPRLDAWHSALGLPRDGRGGAIHSGPSQSPDGRPVVAVTFHWNCPLIPETRSAWKHYDRALPAIAANERWTLLGHGHPRLWGAIRRRWRQLGVDHTPDMAAVLDRADLLVADNTSALYEFASLGKPVLVVNAPWYRRDVHHGLRFWSHPPGLQIDHPHELADGIERALADPPEAGLLRSASVGAAYAHTDGHASERAATAIMEVHDAD